MRAVANLMRAFRHALDPDEADAAALRRYERAGITLSPTLDGSLAVSGLADEVTGSMIATAIDTAAPLVPGDDRTAGPAPAGRTGRHLPPLPRRPRRPAPRRRRPPAPDRHRRPDHPARRRKRQPSQRQHATARRRRGREPPVVPGRAARCPGSAGSPAAPPAGSAATRWPPSSPSARTARSPRPAPAAGSSPPPNAAPSSPATATAAAGPGATGPSAWSDAHHLIPVEPGGPTTVANGALPCEAHHLQLHEGRWRLDRLPDGRYLAHHPATGRTIGPEPHPPGHNRPPPHQRQ